MSMETSRAQRNTPPARMELSGDPTGRPTGRAGGAEKAGAPVCRLRILVVALALAASSMIPAAAPAQARPKVPHLGKTGDRLTRLAFSGKVQSLDTKHGVLNMTVPDREGTEMFPVKKHVEVVNADGAKLKLKALTPGTNVMLYYDQRGGEREVKQIIVLSAAPEKKKSPPPS
jgi:hypothetical protein